MADLRSQFFKNNIFRSRTIEVSVPQAEGDPLLLTVRVKQPTVSERNAIFADTKVGKGGEVKAGSAASTGALAIIYCCRNPETDEPVFTLEDLGTILNTPAGGWVDRLSAEVMAVLVEAQELGKA